VFVDVRTFVIAFAVAASALLAATAFGLLDVTPSVGQEATSVAFMDGTTRTVLYITGEASAAETTLGAVVRAIGLLTIAWWLGLLVATLPALLGGSARRPRERAAALRLPRRRPALVQPRERAA
jgi:hypothetical protein